MKNSVPALSLRTLIMAVVGVLAAATLLFEAIGLHQSYLAYRNASLIVERNRLADGCLQAVKSFAFERGRSNVVLRGPDPISPDNRQFVDARRAKADKHFEEVLARLPESSRDRGNEVQAAWERVKALRPIVDRDFSLSRDERDPALPEEWLAAANDLVAKVEALLIDVSSIPGSADVNFERLSNLRINVLQFRNQLGSVSSALSVEMYSGREPREEVLRELRHLRSRYFQMWTQIERWASHVENFESAEALAKAR